MSLETAFTRPSEIAPALVARTEAASGVDPTVSVVAALAADRGESNRPPPSHTPGQAEGENDDVNEDGGDGETHDPVRRRRPSQAEGEDPSDDAGDAPSED